MTENLVRQHDSKMNIIKTKSNENQLRSKL